MLSHTHQHIWNSPKFENKFILGSLVSTVRFYWHTNAFEGVRRQWYLPTNCFVGWNHADASPNERLPQQKFQFCKQPSTRWISKHIFIALIGHKNFRALHTKRECLLCLGYWVSVKCKWQTTHFPAIQNAFSMKRAQPWCGKTFRSMLPSTFKGVARSIKEASELFRIA